MTGGIIDPKYSPTLGDDLPPGPRPMIATLEAAPGHETQFARAIATLTTAVRTEPGCLEFRAFRSADNPGTFYLYEMYADTEAFRTHLAADHVATFLSAELPAHSTTDAKSLIQLIELQI